MRSASFLCIFYLLSGISLLPAESNTAAWNILLDAAKNAKNPDHRKQAIAAIAAIGPAPEAVNAVEVSLQKDPDAMVRQAAAAALGDMKATAAIPALKAAMQDDSGEVAFSAAKALWDLGDPTGKDTFTEILTKERKGSEGMVSGAMHDAKRTMTDPKKLAFMGVKEASGPLLGPLSMGITFAQEAMKDKANGAAGRALAAEYMSKYCDARVVQLLEWSMKNDDHWLVKAAAARGLGKCADADAIPLLEGYLKDSHEPLKYQAAAAIVRLSLKATPPAATSGATAANQKP